MKTIDTTGFRCPKPLIMLKAALVEAGEGEHLKVITDNETSLKNLVTFLRDQGEVPEVKTSGRVHTIVTQKPAKDLAGTRPEEYCEPAPVRNDYVVCLKSNLMGTGDPELGKILMESFMDHLKLQEHLPTHVILYNSGVKLAMKESPVCSSLSELEERGTRIMLCGTCVDHFGIQYDIGVGMISNMVSITERLIKAAKVIYP